MLPRARLGTQSKWRRFRVSKDPPVGKNDARDQAVSHSDAESLAFEDPADLGGSSKELM